MSTPFRELSADEKSLIADDIEEMKEMVLRAKAGAPINTLADGMQQKFAAALTKVLTHRLLVRMAAADRNVAEDPRVDDLVLFQEGVPVRVKFVTEDAVVMATLVDGETREGQTFTMLRSVWRERAVGAKLFTKP